MLLPTDNVCVHVCVCVCASLTLRVCFSHITCVCVCVCSVRVQGLACDADPNLMWIHTQFDAPLLPLFALLVQNLYVCVCPRCLSV